MIHCRLAAVTCRWAWMDDRATLTMLKSSCSTNCAAQISASGHPAAGGLLLPLRNRSLVSRRVAVHRGFHLLGRQRLSVLACPAWSGQGETRGADVLTAVPGGHGGMPLAGQRGQQRRRLAPHGADREVHILQRP